MKKNIYWGITVILFVLSIILLISNQQLKHRNRDNWIEKSENVILVIDTICNERYVVAIDTITKRAEILGLRRFCESEYYEE